MSLTLPSPPRSDEERVEDLDLSNTDQCKTKRSSSILEAAGDHDKSIKRPKISFLCEQCKQDIPQIRAIFQKKDLPSWDAVEEPVISRKWPTAIANRECELCSLFVSRDAEEELRLRGVDGPVTAEIYQKRFLHSIGECKYAKQDYRYKTNKKWGGMDSICLESRLKDQRGNYQCHSVIVPAYKSLEHSQDNQEVVEPSHSSQSYTACVVDSKRFDDGLVTSWINTCKKVHGTKCTMKQSERSTRAIKAGHPIWLIDCTTRQLRRANFTEPYVALSYVWGSRREHSESAWKHGTGAELPEILPLTIEDAIIATLRLSYRYLWVDFYCIDQRDNAHKASQIAIMDLIYGHAELVIIAAAGNDTGHGLPGVSRVQRPPHRCYEVDESLLLVSYISHPHSSIYHSTWNSRGWTFQEGILAARRLAFTEEQVYFECNCISVWESLRRPLARITGSSTKRITPGARAGFFQSGCTGKLTFSQNGSRTASSLLVNALPTYMQRHLSYEQDYLNAFQGFLERQFPASNFHGLPLMERRGERETIRWGIINALSWSHDIQIKDPAYKDATRKAGFPSFSWTGWTGGANFKNWSINSYLSDTSPVFLGLDETQLVSGHVSSLKMRAFTSQMALICTRTRSGKIIYRTLMGNVLGVSRPIQGEGLEKPEGVKSETKLVVDVLLLGQILRDVFLLIFERKEGFVERCGTISLPKTWNTDMEAVEKYVLEPFKEEIIVLR